MPDFSNIFPYLVPADWPALPYCLCRKVFSGSDLSVAYGEREGDQIKYLMAHHAREEGYSTHDVDAVALPNLFGREDSPDWKSDDVEWNGAMRPLYSRYGPRLVSSDLLNPDCLKQVQALLECDEITVAVPHVGSMYAVATDMSWGLAGVAKTKFEEAKEEGFEELTPYLFTVADGEIKSVDTAEWDPDARPY